MGIYLAEMKIIGGFDLDYKFQVFFRKLNAVFINFLLRLATH